MTWKAHSLKSMATGADVPPEIWRGWKEDSRGLAYEDYWIYVRIVGHQNYRMYNDAHWRDSNIIDKSDVWNKLKDMGNFNE